MKQSEQPTMKRPYQVAGAVLMVYSAFMVRESMALQFYTSLGPGPGFFPFWIYGLLTVLGALMVYNATFGDSPPMPEDFFPARDGYLRVAAIVGALVVLVLVMDSLGFRLSTFAFLFFLLLALGRQSFLLTILVALGGSFGVHYAFQQWLKVQLPLGIFGF